MFAGGAVQVCDKLPVSLARSLDMDGHGSILQRRIEPVEPGENPRAKRNGIRKFVDWYRGFHGV